MNVKVFDINSASNIEGEIRRWISLNPNIRIEAMSQSSASDNTGWFYQVIIIYSIK